MPFRMVPDRCSTHNFIAHNSCIIYRLNCIHKFVINVSIYCTMLNNIIFSTMLSSIMNQKAINFLTIIFNIFINEMKFYCYLILHCILCYMEDETVYNILTICSNERWQCYMCVLTEKRQNFNNILSWIWETRYSFIQCVHTISKFKLNVE